MSEEINLGTTDTPGQTNPPEPLQQPQTALDHQTEWLRGEAALVEEGANAQLAAIVKGGANISRVELKDRLVDTLLLIRRLAVLFK